MSSQYDNWKVTFALGSFGSMFIYFAYKNWKKQRKALKLFKEKGFLPISHVYDQQYKRTKKLPSFRSYTQQYDKMDIVLEGRLFGGEFYLLNNRSKQNVLSLLMKTYKKKMIGKYYLSQDDTQHKVSASRFIQDLNSDYRIDVFGGDRDVFNRLYTYTSCKIKYDNRSLFKRLIQALIDSFGWMNAEASKFGVKMTEESLLLNTPVFAYGTVYLNKINGKLTFKPSDIIASSIKDFKNILQGEVNYSILYLSLSCLMTIFVFRKLFYNTYYNIRETIREIKFNKMLRKMKSMTEDEINDTSCIICFNSIRNIVAMPCKHICMCSPCYNELRTIQQSSKCPICKTKVESIIEWNFI